MDYKNGKIYTIRSKETDLYYIGATIQPLCKRFGEHKRKFKQYGNTYACLAREIMKYTDAYIELYEAFPCDNKEELNKREGQLQRENKNQIVNYQIAGRTRPEYSDETRDKQKKWRTEHATEIKENQAKYYTDHLVDFKIKSAEWRLNNKDKINKRSAEYREENKIKIAEYNKKKKEERRMNKEARKSKIV